EYGIRHLNVTGVQTCALPIFGLINSMSLYARLNAYGFLETPYRKIVDGRVSNEIEYLSAIEESHFVIAQANAALDEEGRFLDDQIGRAWCRWSTESSVAEEVQ